jgi:hypothetical protein
MDGRLPASQQALTGYNEAVCAAILQAIEAGGADAAMEFLQGLAAEFGRDVREYLTELGVPDGGTRRPRSG